MKTLDSFDFDRPIGKSQYDWDTILDGQIRVLEAGEDFTCKPATIKTQARSVAKSRGMAVRTGSTKEGDVVIQAFSPDAEQRPELTGKAKSSRRR
jgi:hypothetical protein